MWFCYTTIKNTNIKHLSVVSESVKDIYIFINKLEKAIGAEYYIFEIIKKEEDEE